MKKSMFFGTLALFVSLLLTAAAWADPPKAREIAKKQAVQQQRIQKGVRSGSLTAAEARILKTEQRKIRKLTRRFLSDGRLNKQERRKLSALQKKAGARIKRLRHNRVQAPCRKTKGPRRQIAWMPVSAGQASGHRV